MTVLLQATPEDVARFMSYVDKLPNGCWVWTGGRSRGKGNRRWYGTFTIKGKKSVRAHRFASEVLGGEPCPPGHHRDHRCCFSLCVNPDHIEVVTKEVNQQRRWARARELLCEEICNEAGTGASGAAPALVRPPATEFGGACV